MARRLPLVLGVMMLAIPARATTYALEDVVYNAASQTAGFGIALPPISLTISGSAVMSGHFDFHAQQGPTLVGGDVAQLVAFQIGGTTIRADGSGGLFSYLDLSLDFDVYGAVTRASFDWLSPTSSFSLSGTGESFGGSFSPSDSTLCGFSPGPAYDCRLSGRLLDPPDPESLVPEPEAALLAAGGLVLLCFARFLWPTQERAPGR